MLSFLRAFHCFLRNFCFLGRPFNSCGVAPNPSSLLDVPQIQSACKAMAPGSLPSSGENRCTTCS